MRYYREREADGSGLDKILGRSPAMVELRARIGRLLDTERRLADGEAPTVLIHGETGTGKELVARALHFDAARRAGPFVELNCGALPAQLIEAELFGHERAPSPTRGSARSGWWKRPTAARCSSTRSARPSLSTQVKLLKLLEDKRFRRLGSAREQQVNVRIVSATHRPLEELVKDGQFRADLFYRLRVVEIKRAAAARARRRHRELAHHFLQLHAQRYRRGAMR